MPVELNPDSTRMLSWSYENAVALQKIGHRTALPIAQALAGRPEPSRIENSLAPYRFADHLLETRHHRTRQLLRGIFNPSLLARPSTDS